MLHIWAVRVFIQLRFPSIQIPTSTMDSSSPLKVSSKKKPAILFIMHSHICGGAEKHILTLMRGFHEQGYRVAFCGPMDSWLADTLKTLNIPCFHVPLHGYFDVYSLFLIVYWTLFFKADILHGHMTRGALYAAYAARITRRASLSTAHLMDSYLRFNLTDKVIAVSHAVKQQLIDKGLTCSRIEVVHNGITLPSEDDLKNRIKVREELGLKPDDKALCMLSFLELFKGHDLAFKALRQLNRSDLKLVIIGRTEGVDHYETLQHAVESFGLEQQVLFLGHREDIYRLLSGMDIFLMASRREAFSMAAVESAACGLPVITANVGGIPEVFSDGSTALFFESGNADDLVRCIQRLLDEPLLKEQIALSAKERVSTRFSSSQMVTSTLSVYESLLNTSASQRIKPDVHA